MKALRTTLICLSALGLVLSAAFAAEAPMLAKAKMFNAEGKVIGYVVLTEGHDGVQLALNLHSLPPGLHAFHIHQAGVCEPPFKSAKGHFNPYGKKHGLRNPEGPHVGDMQNILVAPDGTVAAVRLAPLATLGEGVNSLFQPGGTAIVIHAGPDDYMSDPAGDAGPRIACGVIKQVGEKKSK